VTIERHVDVEWQGSVMEGKGEAEGWHRGVFAAGHVPLADRANPGQDQPEELMAAAHAACYAMALNGTLGRKGASADRTQVTAHGLRRQG